MWSTITIIFIIISIITPFLLITTKKRIKHPSYKIQYKPEDLLKSIGVDISNIHNKESYLTTYQGGNFIFNFKKDVDYIDVIYPGFEYFPLEHIQKALMAANNINYKYATWTCYVEKTNEDIEAKQFKANLSARLKLTENFIQIQNYLKETLSSAFRIARSFCEILTREIQESTETEKFFFNDAIFNAKLEHIRNLNYLKNENEKQENKHTVSPILTISNLIALYKNIDLGCLQSMLLTCQEKTEKWTEISKIMHFDIREYIRKRDDAQEIQYLTLTLCFEQQELFVHLTKTKGSTLHTLFFTVNILRSGSELDTCTGRHTSVYSQTLMEIRLSNPDKDYWEAQYIVDDAQDKVQSGRITELNDEQLLILANTNPTIQLSLYWGKKYYNKHCYLQSLFYFHQIHQQLIKKCKDWNKKERDLYYTICYYIGSIYMSINMFEKAFYYLFIAQGQRFDAAIGFMDCLCYMNDPNAKEYINSTLEQTIKQMHESDEESEKLSGLYQLLKRRYAHVLVSRKEWEEAKMFLTKMIENGEDIEFAQSELDYIRRNQEKEEGNTTYK